MYRLQGTTFSSLEKVKFLLGTLLHPVLTLFDLLYYSLDNISIEGENAS